MNLFEAMVPRYRLLLWTGILLLPCSLLIAVRPTTAPICAAIAAGLTMLTITDAIRGRRTLSEIEVQLPAIARMSKDRIANVEVRIRNKRLCRRTLRIALNLPVEFSCVDEMEVTLEEGAEWSRLVWQCTPVKRGKYNIVNAYVETPSEFRFWALRRTFAIQLEIRVYPNLLRERKAVAGLFLNRGLLGMHLQRQVGQGRDFEKLREYAPGDSYDQIHWKATARRGRPITKVFHIERTQEIYVVVDASRLSSRPAGPDRSDTLFEKLVTAALLLGLAAERQGDLFGVVTFADKIEGFVRAKNGKSQYNLCRDALYMLQPRVVTPDFDELCSFIRLRLRRRALIVFLTSLDDASLAESFVRNVDLIRRQHLVMVNMIRPHAVDVMFNNSDLSSVDDLYARLGGHLRWHKLRQLEKTLQRRGVLFSLLENDRFSADVVSRYLNVKQRQLI